MNRTTAPRIVTRSLMDTPKSPTFVIQANSTGWTINQAGRVIESGQTLGMRRAWLAAQAAAMTRLGVEL